MESFDTFKNRIVKYGIVLMFIIEIASIPVIGLNYKFALGLLLGTAISVVNLYLLAFQCRQVIMQGNKLISVWGYLLRLFLFGAVAVICIKISLRCGVGAILGILTTKAAMFIVSMSRSKEGKEAISDIKAELPESDMKRAKVDILKTDLQETDRDCLNKNSDCK